MNDRNILYAHAANHFMTFATLAWGVLNPGRRFEQNWHHWAIAQTVQEMMVSREWRQVINTPPRSGKTFLVSEALPAFILGRAPARQVLCVTYGEKLSKDQSENTARIMRSNMYRRVFPNVRLVADTQLQLKTSRGGRRFATSVGGPTTGFGGDWIIIDDPHNAAEVYNASARERVKTYFDRALSSRSNDETSAHMLLVMQRLHADDLSGHVLGQGGWQEMKLQAKATEPAEFDIGAREMHRVRVGDLLHPARLPQAVLDRKLIEMGSMSFGAQFEQNPVPAEGNIVNSSWLRYYDSLPSRLEGRIVVSIDTATKTNPANDYSVATVWLLVDGRSYLIDLWREKVEFHDLKQRVIDLFNVHRPDHVLIEDQASGTALIQELVRLSIPALGCRPSISKEQRLIPATASIQAGLMLLPKEAPWLATYVDELLAFPNGRHDDQVDSTSQYFTWVRENPPMFFSYSFLYGP